jgi:hypothetical protein
MTYDANDPLQVGKAEEDAQRSRARLQEDLAEVLATEGGRRLVWHLLESAHCFHSSFAADAMLTAFREGERNLGLMLLAEAFAAAPDRLAEMVRENAPHLGSPASGPLSKS